jgi:uncharacterized protein YutD
MLKKVMINDKYYELIEDYKDGFSLSDVSEKMTDYFDGYDYIIGDWAYGKLRLKGFCDNDNPNYRKINDIKDKDKYIKNNCAYDCKYFVLRKVKDSVSDANI